MQKPKNKKQYESCKKQLNIIATQIKGILQKYDGGKGYIKRFTEPRNHGARTKFWGTSKLSQFQMTSIHNYITYYNRNVFVYGTPSEAYYATVSFRNSSGGYGLNQVSVKLYAPTK